MYLLFFFFFVQSQIEFTVFLVLKVYRFMKITIALIPGDGIGPDILHEAVRVIDAVTKRFGHTISYTSLIAGGEALDQTGEPFPREVLYECRRTNAVLTGPFGGPRWDSLPIALRPERALLELRKGLDVFASFRPFISSPSLSFASPVKDHIINQGFNFLIINELQSGIYNGDKGLHEDGSCAWDTELCTDEQISRVLRISFEAARSRRKKLCLVDKANMLESSRLWREVTRSFSFDYQDVEIEYVHINKACRRLIRNPSSFDVIVTNTLFGDILTDIAGEISGSIGMIPSAAVGESGTPWLYGPLHGTAPDMLGKNSANPIAAILSAAMLLRHSLSMDEEALLIERAVENVITKGYRTKDICRITSADKSTICVGTSQMCDAILEEIQGL